MTYDVLIIGGGPGGIYTAWELLNKRPDLKLALFESGHTLERRRCPIDGVKVKSCVHCPTCAIMNGFGGAGAFSDGKYNILKLSNKSVVSSILSPSISCTEIKIFASLPST